MAEKRKARGFTEFTRKETICRRYKKKKTKSQAEQGMHQILDSAKRGMEQI